MAENIPEWEKDDAYRKRATQQSIQDALKQQIADKENLKRHNLEVERLHDEKEQRRLDVERQMLTEKYAREKEEARLKDDKDRLENEARALEKARLEKSNSFDSRKEDRSQLPAPKRHVPELAGDRSPVNAPIPFRSSSPPIPTVLKRMKEQGLAYNAPPPEPVLQEEVSTPVTLTESHIPNIPQPTIDEPPAFKQIPNPPSTNFPVHVIPEPVIQDQGGNNNLMILEQLSAIQRVCN